MVRNKLLILISSIVIGTSLFSEEKTQSVIQEKKINFEKKLSYIRLDYGVPFLFTLNFGKRLQVNHHGLDMSAGTTFWPHFYEIQSNIDYLFFPKLNLESQYYFGIGLKSLFFIFSSNYCFSYQPEIVLGKEYVKKNGKNRFLEIKIGYYCLAKRMWFIDYPPIESNLHKWPMIYICHGIQF